LVAQLLREQVVATLTPRGERDGFVRAIAFEVPRLTALDAFLRLEPFELLRSHGWTSHATPSSSSASTTATATATATSSPTTTGSDSIEGVIVVLVLIQEVVEIACFEGVEEFLVLLLWWSVEVEVVEGGAVLFPIVPRVVAGDNKIVDGVVGCACLDCLNGFIHCHMDFDACGEVAVLEGADELEKLIVLGDRNVENSEVMDVVLKLRDVSVQSHDWRFPFKFAELDS
jgi:hypothetical protein